MGGCGWRREWVRGVVMLVFVVSEMLWVMWVVALVFASARVAKHVCGGGRRQQEQERPSWYACLLIRCVAELCPPNKVYIV